MHVSSRLIRGITLQSTSDDFFDRFFHVSLGGLKRGSFRAELLDENPAKPGTDFLRGETPFREPVHFGYAMGGKPRDVIGATSAGFTLVSPKFFGVLEENEFSGWESYAVEITDKAGEPIEGYRGLLVRGRCGPIDFKRSVLAADEHLTPNDTLARVVGLYFDPDTWDGSDIFMPAAPGHYPIVTEEVKRALARAKVTNIDFTRLPEKETMARMEKLGDRFIGPAMTAGEA